MVSLDKSAKIYEENQVDLEGNQMPPTAGLSIKNILLEGPEVRDAAIASLLGEPSINPAVYAAIASSSGGRLELLLHNFELGSLLICADLELRSQTQREIAYGSLSEFIDENSSLTHEQLNILSFIVENYPADPTSDSHSVIEYRNSIKTSLSAYTSAPTAPHQEFLTSRSMLREVLATDTLNTPEGLSHISEVSVKNLLAGVVVGTENNPLKTEAIEFLEDQDPDFKILKT